MNTRRNLVDTDEPVEIKMYEFADVERMARRRQEDSKVRLDSIIWLQTVLLVLDKSDCVVNAHQLLWLHYFSV